MTDRITLPASVIEDARAHPERYRPEVEAGDRVLVVNGTLGSDGLIGTVMAKSVQVTGDPVIGISGGGTTHTVFGWLRVGGVEQGPRPEVSGRVLVLKWQSGKVDPRVVVVVDNDPRVPDKAGSINVDFPDSVSMCTGFGGPISPYYATEWALLPAEDDGMGEATAAMDRGATAADEARRWSDALGFGDGITEPAASLSDVAHMWERLKYDANDHAECPFWCDDCEQWEKRYSCGACNGSGCGPGTALGAYDPCRECGGDATDHRAYKLTSSDEGRTVGSLGAGDVGSTMTALGLALVIDQITHYRDEYDGELRVGITGRRGRFDDEQSFPADTPCRVSDGPGEG